MVGCGRNSRKIVNFCGYFVTFVCASSLLGCDAHSHSGSAEPAQAVTGPPAAPPSVPGSASSAPAPSAPFEPLKVEVQDEAMGTSLHFVAYTSPQAGEPETRAAIARAIAEIRRLEALLSEWKPESEIGQVNAHPGDWVKVGAEAAAVLERGLWAGKLSSGSFDITFQSLSRVWKFGSAREVDPKPPSALDIARLKRRVDYRRVELDLAKGRVRIGRDQQIGLGGIAKGYIVDQAARTLKEGGVRSFLAQAGGDLYGAGLKPDGSPWVSGIRDPRAEGYFAVLQLTDHAFSTAGDYARAYVVGGRRYHHIIDPHTGYPATACRSVTVWAPDATTADAVDDAVFILGPERGLALVESLDGVGAVIVDANNQVFFSERVKDKVKVLKAPTGGI